MINAIDSDTFKPPATFNSALKFKFIFLQTQQLYTEQNVRKTLLAKGGATSNQAVFYVHNK